MDALIRADVLKRLDYVQGHLEGIRRMVERDEPCVGLLRQTYAVRQAIHRVEAILLASYLHARFVPGIRRGQPSQLIGQLVDLYVPRRRRHWRGGAAFDRSPETPGGRART